MKQSIRCTVAGMVMAALGWGGSAEAASQEEIRQITVRVYDYEGVPAKTLAKAQNRMSEIFLRAGIEIDWLECAAPGSQSESDAGCSVPVGKTDIMMRILTEKMALRMGRTTDCIGFAFLSDSGMGNTAGIFYHEVMKLERSRNVPRFASMAIFMAHEVGHLMLPGNGHSKSGVMRPFWGPEVMLRAAYGQVDFSTKQLKQMAKNVERRARVDRESEKLLAMGR